MLYADLENEQHRKISLNLEEGTSSGSSGGEEPTSINDISDDHQRRVYVLI